MEVQGNSPFLYSQDKAGIKIKLRLWRQKQPLHIQQPIPLLIAGKMEIRGRILQIIFDLFICHLRIFA